MKIEVNNEELSSLYNLTKMVSDVLKFHFLPWTELTNFVDLYNRIKGLCEANNVSTEMKPVVVSKIGPGARMYGDSRDLVFSSLDIFKITLFWNELATRLAQRDTSAYYSELTSDELQVRTEKIANRYLEQFKKYGLYTTDVLGMEGFPNVVFVDDEVRIPKRIF